MTEARSSWPRWRAYAELLAKVVLLSWPILALFVALNAGPAIVDGLVTGDALIARLREPLIVSVKLWLLSVGVLVAVSSLIYWSLVSRKAGTP